jgi:hypothetical protein
LCSLFLFCILFSNLMHYLSILSGYKSRFAESIDSFIDLDEVTRAFGGNGHDEETPHNESPEDDGTVIPQSHPPTRTPSRQSPVVQVTVSIIFPYLHKISNKEDPPAVSPVQEEAKMKNDTIHYGLVRVIGRVQTHWYVLTLLIELNPGTILRSIHVHIGEDGKGGR